jgi:hypothetical protein
MEVSGHLQAPANLLFEAGQVSGEDEGGPCCCGPEVANLCPSPLRTFKTFTLRQIKSRRMRWV